jgi:methylsterol monooxygenase
VVGWVLFNQIVVSLPVAYLSYIMMKWRGFPPLRELPTFHWVLVEMAVHILMEEIGFYYSHRYSGKTNCLLHSTFENYSSICH